MAFPSLENTAKNIVGTVQDYSLFAYRGATNLFRPPVYWPDFLVQADVIGVGSTSIVLLSGFFTGGVLASNLPLHYLNSGRRPSREDLSANQ